MKTNNFKLDMNQNRMKAILNIPEVASISHEKYENMMLLIVDKKGDYSAHMIGVGTSERVDYNLNDIVQIYNEEVNRRGFCAAILLHNHPSGLLMPSPGDIVMNDKTSKYIKERGVAYLDQIIVGRYNGKTSGLSLKENGYM